MYAVTDLPEINQLEADGLSVCLQSENNQDYLEVTNFSAGDAWNKKLAHILITIPSTYHLGAPLDGFYVEGGILLSNGQRHPRMAAECTIFGRIWWQVSWHYHEHKKWGYPKDNLLTHVYHCGVFFKQGSRSE